MTRDYLQEALKLLLPETPDWYSWAKVDSSGNKIPNDQRMQAQYEIVEESHIGKVTRPTDKQINDKVAELKADDVAKKYQRDRQPEYPQIGDQLDMLFHAIDAGTLDKSSDFYTTLKAVKDKYPKG